MHMISYIQDKQVHSNAIEQCQTEEENLIIINSSTTIFDDDVVVIVNCDVPVKYEEKSKNLQKYYLGS